MLSWLRALPDTPVTTVVTRAEIMAGLALLPGAVLPLPPESADHYGDIVAHRRKADRPIGSMDALIAAISRQLDGSLATRDISDFSGLSLRLVDPWGEGRPG